MEERALNIRNTRILAIEDDPSMIKLISTILKSEGYDVITAQNGVDGITTAKESKPDIILLDLMLPEMSGWEVLRDVRSNEEIADTYILLLTAIGDESSRVVGLERGADDYITKPFNPEELVARIEVITRRMHSAGTSQKKSDSRDFSKIVIEKDEGYMVVEACDVVFVQRQGDFTLIHLKDAVYATTDRLAEIGKHLPGDLFFRVHRSYIVNLNEIAEIGRGDGDTLNLILKDKDRSSVPVSRMHSAELKKILRI